MQLISFPLFSISERQLKGNVVTLGCPGDTAVENECLLTQPLEKKQQTKSLQFTLPACLNTACMSHLLKGHCVPSVPGFSNRAAMNAIV